MHAHIDPEIGKRRLETLGSVVFAATRSMEEFERTLVRADVVTIWGVGCHPELVSAQESFDETRFDAAMARTPFVSEVGLDGSSRVPMQHQLEVFRSILLLAGARPTIVSVHSRRATTRVLDIIEETEAQGIVLHWWLGTIDETARAIELGCFFSLNRSMGIGKSSWSSIPLDRLLCETDHPSGNRQRRGLSQPGWTLDVEEMIATAFGVKQDKIRNHLWSNLSELVNKANAMNLLPIPVQSMLEAVASET
jgi:TatD DNase family protein